MGEDNRYEKEACESSVDDSGFNVNRRGFKIYDSLEDKLLYRIFAEETAGGYALFRTSYPENVISLSKGGLLEVVSDAYLFLVANDQSGELMGLGDKLNSYADSEIERLERKAKEIDDRRLSEHVVYTEGSENEYKTIGDLLLRA